MNVTVTALEEKFPGEGKERYNEIAKLAGGDPAGGSFGNHDGGLDLTGVFDGENDAFSDEARGRIKALAENKTALKKEPATESTAKQTGTQAPPAKKEGEQ